MKFLTPMLLIIFACQAYAKEDKQACSNYAKYEAIRKYKSDTGVVQGSVELEYSADLIKTTATQYEYVVEITDSNEDGEYWTLAYTVTLKKKSCELVTISDAEVVSTSEEEL